MSGLNGRWLRAGYLGQTRRPPRPVRAAPRPVDQTPHLTPRLWDGEDQRAWADSRLRRWG